MQERLPIGTVVRAPGIEVDLMVAGYDTCDPEGMQAADYAVAPIPGGYVVARDTGLVHDYLGLRAEVVGEVVFMGLVTAESRTVCAAPVSAPAPAITDLARLEPPDLSRTMLPLGSVVTLPGRGSGSPVMIGRFAANGPDGAVHDYIGHPYPAGVEDGERTSVLFDNADIDGVLFLGYVDAHVQRCVASLPLFAARHGIPLPFLKSKKFIGRKLELTK